MIEGGATRRYALFGLILESEIELPDLPLSRGDGSADMTVRLGKVPGEEGVAGGGHYIHRVADVAAYRVEDGVSILVDPVPGADESHVRLFLLGTVVGIALHQRGLLPLHANGVEIAGRAVLFMGASGAGKSTLASWFVRNGFRLVADDVCAITIADGAPLVLPGIPRFRLWEDAMVGQGLSPDGLHLSYAGDDAYRKYDVPVEPGSRVSETLPLGGIYVLHRSAETSIVRLAGVDAIQELYAHTYRGEFVALLGLRESHLRICSLLANEVPVHRANREWGLADMDRVNEDLLKHAQAAGGLKDAPTRR